MKFRAHIRNFRVLGTNALKQYGHPPVSKKVNRNTG